jgi:hypothetical protein
MSPSRKLWLMLLNARSMVAQVRECDRANQHALVDNYEEMLDEELERTDTPPTSRKTCDDAFLAKRAALNAIDRHFVAKHRQLERECDAAKRDAFRAIDKIAQQAPQKGSVIRVGVLEWKWGSR